MLDFFLFFFFFLEELGEGELVLSPNVATVAVDWDAGTGLEDDPAWATMTGDSITGAGATSCTAAGTTSDGVLTGSEAVVGVEVVAFGSSGAILMDAGSCVSSMVTVVIGP